MHKHLRLLCPFDELTPLHLKITFVAPLLLFALKSTFYDINIVTSTLFLFSVSLVYILKIIYF